MVRIPPQDCQSFAGPIAGSIADCQGVHLASCSSYIPDTLLENRMVNVGSEDLLRAAEQFLLQPTRTEAKDAKEATRLRMLTEMCSEFLLTDEQLQHIEERMVMEVRDQISSFPHFHQMFQL